MIRVEVVATVWGLDPLNVFCLHHTLLNNIFVALSISEISKEKD